MLWINNLIEYEKTGAPGVCPVCGGKTVNIETHTFQNRKSVTFSCKDCNATDHFDGVKKTEE